MKQRERERETGLGEDMGWAASWNLSFLDPVFPSYGHSVAGKKCAVYLKCWITWQRQGLWIRVHNDFRRRERGCMSVRGRREKEWEAECNRLNCERDFWLTNTTSTLLLSSFLHWRTLANQQTVTDSHPWSGKFDFHCILRSWSVFPGYFPCVRKDGRVRAWVRCLLSLPLSICVCVLGTAWVVRLSFLRTALIENRDFKRGRKNNRNS